MMSRRKSRALHIAGLITAISAAPAYAAENIDCVAQGMSDTQRSQLTELAQLDNPDNTRRLPEVFTILMPTARACREQLGWSQDAMDDAMKVSFYRIVVALAERADGIPADVRARADAFLAAEPAGTMDGLASGATTGGARAAWIVRLWEAAYPGQSLDRASDAQFRQFHWLNMYLLFRHMGAEREILFRQR